MKNRAYSKKYNSFPHRWVLFSWGLLLVISCQTVSWQPAIPVPVKWHNRFAGAQANGGVCLRIQREDQLEQQAMLDWVREWRTVRADLTDPLGRTLLFLSWEPQKGLSMRGAFANALFAPLSVDEKGVLQWHSHVLGFSLWELTAFLEGKLPHEWQARTVQVSSQSKYAMVKVQDTSREIVVQFLDAGRTSVEVAWPIWWGLRTQRIRIEFDSQGGYLHLPGGNEVSWMIFSS